MSRFTLLLLSPIILLISACSPPQGAPTQKASASTEEIMFKTARAVASSVPFSFQATGSFIAEDSSDVAPTIGGRVASTPVEVGDHVKKGQAICILEHRDAQLKLDQARAGREQARFMLSQAQSRVGWSGDGGFNPGTGP
jgi:multidrug efflux pump subunit AcrA (membrane-fusion protein)